MAAAFVGQEAVTLSTTPVFVGGFLEPRPASLRVYLARTPEGWIVMPGGFARIGSSLDTTAIAMQRGGQAADVWVVSAKPVKQETLLPDERDGFKRSLPGTLPSRAAENLMWLGRYIERSEDTARILRAYHVRLAETSDPDMPLLADIRDYLEPYGIDAEAAIPAALIGSLDSAVYSAGQIRDRFSPDGWLALRDLSKTIHRFAAEVAPGDDATRAMTVILRKLAGFSGLLQREHVPLHRLALPGDRPAARARHPDRPLACLADARGCARRRARHDAGDRRQRHDPPPPIRSRRAAQPRRPAGARPAQPALGAVPARPAEA